MTFDEMVEAAGDLIYPGTWSDRKQDSVMEHHVRTVLTAAGVPELLAERDHWRGEHASALGVQAVDKAEIARLRVALGALVVAVERVCEGERRYWPRDMRLDGTAAPVESALDAALAALHPEEPSDA